MRWSDLYHDRCTSAAEAVKLIRSGSRVYVGGNAAAPFVLMEALAGRAGEIEDVEITHVLLIGNDPFSRPEASRCFRHNSFFVGSADREGVNQGRSDYVPIHLHEVPRLFSEGIAPLDAVLVQTTPPDEHGFMSLGVECLSSMAAITKAPLVIAQVNLQMPRTLGDCFVHVSRFSRLVEDSSPLLELERPGFSGIEKRIGDFVAEIVDDGSTLQLGIGAIPDAVLTSLKGKRDLGIHTEMVSDGIMEGIESGLITGSRKSLHEGKVICTFALGSRRLYDFLNNNPLFEFHPVEYTNDPRTVAQNDRMVAINSALEIDLTGQVCSDSIGNRIYSGFGGQVDFIRGSAHSREGRSIIAMPSTARNGQLSRIVSGLSPGAGVVTSRADVHWVVTEFGSACLKGKNLRQRAHALIGIAHPDFQEQLLEEAHSQGVLGSSVKVP